MADHIVHIGVHKTGSTWLQRHVFPSVAGASFANDAIFKALLRNLTDDEYFYSSTFKSAIAEVEGERVLLSSERLAAGRAWGEEPSHPERNADRLAEIVPDAKIILFTRDAGSLAESLYSQYIQEGGYLPRSVFIDSTLHADYLDMGKAVKRYQSRFSNVLVLPFEQLRAEPLDCVRRIADFAGVEFATVPTERKANISLYGWRLQFLRRLNRTFRRSAYNPEPPLPVPYAGALRVIIQKTHR